MIFLINSIQSCQMADRHASIKQLSRKEAKFHSKPWITSGLKTSIKIKNILYKQFIKTQSYYNQCKYKIDRNKLLDLIRLSKKNYYKEYFASNSKNTKHI
jgi:hypothetical protein